MPRILRSVARLLAGVVCLPVFVNVPTVAGFMPGSFQDSPADAATYTIPIAVPPGAGHIQHSLSLACSSQSGNGLVGMGFSLQGLFAITRCPQTYATDGNMGDINLTYRDLLCLDGLPPCDYANQNAQNSTPEMSA